MKFHPLIFILIAYGITAVISVCVFFIIKAIAFFVRRKETPRAGNCEELMYSRQIDFLQPVYTFMFSNGLIACLVFMGIGAVTDIDILLARPGMSFFLAVFAELGTIATLPIAMAMGLLPNEAAAIALVGGADGPMVLYGSLLMARDLF